MARRATKSEKIIAGFGRTPVDLVSENLLQALRVLELVPVATTDLTPHPIAVVRAEIMNAKRHLGLIQVAVGGGADAHV